MLDKRRQVDLVVAIHVGNAEIVRPGSHPDQQLLESVDMKPIDARR